MCVWWRWGEELGGGFAPAGSPREQACGGKSPAGPTGNHREEGPERKAGEAGHAPAGPWKPHGAATFLVRLLVPRGSPRAPASSICPPPWVSIHLPSCCPYTYWLLGTSGHWLMGSRNLPMLFLTTTHESPMTSEGKV